MSLDRRLKGAFDRAAQEIDPAVETQLAATIRRAESHRTSPLGVGLVAAGLIVLALMGVRFLSFADNQGGAATHVPSPSPSPSASTSAQIGPALVANRYVVTLEAADPGVAELGMIGVW